MSEYPSFTHENGTRFIWDPTTHSYVVDKSGHSDIDRNVRRDTGGDNNLFSDELRFEPMNPMQEGILARKAEEKDEDEDEETEWDGIIPDVQHIDDLPAKTPRTNQQTTDNSFPTKISTDLDSCPQCSEPLMNDGDERVCSTCGTRQPVLTLSKEDPKMAFLAPLIAPLAEGIAGAGAAGAAEGAAGETGIGEIGGLMNKAKGANGVANGIQNAENKIDEPMDEAAVNGPQPSLETLGSSSTSDMFADEQDLGRDDEPGEETQGFNEAVGDDPAFFKDVQPGSKPKSTKDDGPQKNASLERKLAEDFGFDIESDDVDDSNGGDKDLALRTFEHCKPLVLHYVNSDESADDNPVLKALDDLLESAFPGYKDDNGNLVPDDLESAPKEESDTKSDKPDSEESDSDDDSDKDDSVKEAAIHESRKPKMCEFHRELVDYSLNLGPEAALNAMRPDSYGNNWCKGEKFEGKCNFKPIMVTQKYWDDKAAQAEQRKIDRDEMLQTPELDMTAEPDLDFIPAETAEDFTESPPETFTEVFDTSPAIDAPGVSEAPLMAAASADTKLGVILDTHGRPLVAGSEYKMKSPAYSIPETITVEKATDDDMTYVNHTSGLSFRDVITAQEIENSNLEFEPLHIEADPAPAIDLSRDEREASVPEEHLGLREAGRHFTNLEQRELIQEGEGSLARNSHRLRLENTHYEDMNLTPSNLENDSFWW